MPTLIVLIGPTGVGKTELSLRLAENFQTHIVSADSRQLYAELKIGTATPTPVERATGCGHFFKINSLFGSFSGFLSTFSTIHIFTGDDWEKEKEVTLEEMDDNPEIDSWVMKETPISELIEDEKQKLLYVFDYMTERCFFIELTEIITGKDMNGAKCTIAYPTDFSIASWKSKNVASGSICISLTKSSTSSDMIVNIVSSTRVD